MQRQKVILEWQKKQISYGIKNIMDVPTYRIQTPKPALVAALRMALITFCAKHNWMPFCFFALSLNVIQPIIKAIERVFLFPIYHRFYAFYYLKKIGSIVGFTNNLENRLFFVPQELLSCPPHIPLGLYALADR